MRAVITGAGSGLGRAFCVELARSKASVVVSDIDGEGAEETANLVRKHGGKAFVRLCDVSDAEQVTALEKAAIQDLGTVDLLCNNAGVAVSGAFEEISLKEWRWIVDINLWGVIHGCHAFLPAMRARGAGQVINVASAAGLLCAPEMSPYNTTKSAVISLTESLSAEYRGTGVHLTVVCPTFFQTSILDSARGPLNPRMRAAQARMRSSQVQAPEVARQALKDASRARLYSVPMRDGRVLWRLKRLAPEGFYRAVSRMFRFQKIRATPESVAAAPE